MGHGTLKNAPNINHETLKEKGFVDHIVTREKMKLTLYNILTILT